MTTTFDDATGTDFNNITSGGPALNPYNGAVLISQAINLAKTSGQEAENNYRDTQQKVWIYYTRTSERINLTARNINDRAFLTNIATSGLVAGVPDDNLGNIIRDEARSRARLKLFEKTGQYSGYDVVKLLSFIPWVGWLITSPFWIYPSLFLNPRIERESAKIGNKAKADFLQDVEQFKRDGKSPSEAKEIAIKNSLDREISIDNISRSGIARKSIETKDYRHVDDLSYKRPTSYVASIKSAGVSPSR
jgi:hypothetical protein